MSLVSLFVKRNPDTKSGVLQPLQLKPTLLNDISEAVKSKRVTSRLAAKAVNSGDLCMEGGLQVLGIHEGNLVITSDNGIVWIGETGIVKGHIEAKQVYVQGLVNGTVHADIVIIEGNGKVEGEIFANRVLMRNMVKAFMSASVSSRETLVGQSSANIISIAEDPN